MCNREIEELSFQAHRWVLHRIHVIELKLEAQVPRLCCEGNFVLLDISGFSSDLNSKVALSSSLANQIQQLRRES